MRLEYLIFPSAIQKIERNGIKSRVEKFKKSESCYIEKSIDLKDAFEKIKYIHEKGYFNEFPKGYKEQYQRVLNGILRNSEEYVWKIKRNNEVIIEKTNVSDIDLFGGRITSLILKPKGMWNYQKYGFSTPYEMCAIVSQYLLENGQYDYENKGYTWTKTDEQNRKIEIIIGGSQHFDLRIYKKDITPYETIDPFGRAIEMRPIIRNDYETLAAYHSTETTLFIIVMKWIEQMKMNSVLRNNGTELLDYVNNLQKNNNPFSGGCAEHFFSERFYPPMFFVGYTLPIPQLNENNQKNKNEYSHFSLIREFNNSWYSPYINPKGNLVFADENSENRDCLKKKIVIEFEKQDAEHLLKGLLYQCQFNLGRTPVKNLVESLKYRFSEQFEKETKI